MNAHGILDELAWYVSEAGSALIPYNIYVKQTTANSVPDQSWSQLISDATLVKTGNLSFIRTGWQRMELDQAFAYSAGNLLILVEVNYGGNGTVFHPHFATFTNDPSLHRVWQANTTIPSGNGSTSVQTPLITMHLDAFPQGYPAAPQLSFPADNAFGLPVQGFDLIWEADLISGAQPDYYALFLASDEEQLYDEYYWETTQNSFDPVSQGGVNFGYDQQWWWTVQAVILGVGDAIADPPRRFTITSPPPQIVVQPSSFSQNLSFGQSSSQELQISNPGGLALDYAITLQQSVGNQRETFDLQFSHAASPGEYGISSDGIHIYTSYWEHAGRFGLYNLDGSFVESFTIANAGAARDLSWDGELFYAATLSSSIDILDFHSRTKLGSIPSPFSQTRGIAYDADADGFWITDAWTSNCKLIDRSGNVLQSVTLAGFSNAGLGYDSSDGFPSLWAHAQVGESENSLIQYDLSSGALLRSFDAGTVIPELMDEEIYAGGMDIVYDLVQGKTSILALAQGFAFYCVELGDYLNWIQVTPRHGSIAAGSSAMINISFDASEINPGSHQAIIKIKHNDPALQTLEIPVTLNVSGSWPAEFSINPTIWDYEEVELLNPKYKLFTITNLGGAVPSPLILDAASFSLSSDPAHNFQIQAFGLPVSLDHRQSYSFKVAFIPQSLGQKTATLNISHNMGSFNLSLSGTSIPETIGSVANLEAAVINNEDVLLTWVHSSGEAGQAGWLYYDDGICNTGIGTGDPNISFEVAMKFESQELYPFASMQITQFMYYPLSEMSSYELRIWTGSDANTAPSTLVYSQALEQIPESYNAVQLSTPYTITGTSALWIGYKVSIPADATSVNDLHPAGADVGPAVVGYGDLINMGYWASLYDLSELSINWNIRAYVDNPRTKLLDAPLLSLPILQQIPSREELRKHRFVSMPREGSAPTRVLQGFNIYRDDTLGPINPEPISSRRFTDHNVPVGNHSYWVQGVYYSGLTNLAGPANIEITPNIAHELPFSEDWSSGSFASNSWMADVNNWSVGSGGNPGRTAIFEWEPPLFDFSEALTSYRFNGVPHGSVILSFDLELLSYDDWTENLLSLQIGLGNQWYDLHTWSSYDYDDQSFAFTAQSFDISQYAAGNLFKIRFIAHGEDTFSLEYWKIDNISIIGAPALDLDAPLLQIQASGADLLLSWPVVPNADGYNVYASDDPYNGFELIGYTTENSHLITAPSSMKFYKVTSVKTRTKQF